MQSREIQSPTGDDDHPCWIFVGARRRSVRHVHDIIGHGAAFEEVQRLSVFGNSQISIDQVKKVHELVLFGSVDGGVCRKEGEIAVITATKVLLAMPDETEALVRRLLIWLSNNSDVHPGFFQTWF